MSTQITGPTFKIGRGVRQEDPLLSNLFNCTLEEIFRKMKCENEEMKIDGKYLNNVRFADDVVLIGNNVEEIQEMFQEFWKCSEEAGLTNNDEKNDIYE